MRRSIVGLFLFFLFCSCAFASERDFQYWKIEQVGWKVAKDWQLSLTEEVYFRDNASDFYYEHTELAVSYSGLAKWLDVGVNYRHALSKSTKGVWTREEQPSFQGILKWTIKGFSISDRNRFECRIKEDAEDFWRYRNLLTIKFPLKVTRLEIQPYFRDEFFVDIDKEEINENRLQPGLSFQFTKQVGLDIFYMWRRVKSGNKWITNDIIGSRLRLSF